ncbi:hypothetical protein ACLOJK_040345 [Asimina triloba]
MSAWSMPTPSPVYPNGPTVASYMVVEDEHETPSPKTIRIWELEDELRRVKLVIDSLEAARGATLHSPRRALHPAEEATIQQSENTSEEPTAWVQVDPDA